VFRSSKYHGNLVRIGQSLYGFVGDDISDKKVEESGENGQATGPEFAREARELRSAVRWTSSIVQVKEIPEGSPVGYGSTWRAPRRTRLALIPVGYADGYPRALTNAGMVGLTGRAWEKLGGAGSAADESVLAFAPVVGRVSMDQITVDVTDVPEHACRVGMEAELIGRDRRGANYLPRLSESAGTITHELLTRIGARVERVYRYPSAAGMEQASEISVRVPTRGAGETGGGESTAGGAAVA
jgi:alanine racemase